MVRVANDWGDRIRRRRSSGCEESGETYGDLTVSADDGDVRGYGRHLVGISDTCSAMSVCVGCTSSPSARLTVYMPCPKLSMAPVLRVITSMSEPPQPFWSTKQLGYVQGTQNQSPDVHRCEMVLARYIVCQLGGGVGWRGGRVRTRRTARSGSGRSDSDFRAPFGLRGVRRALEHQPPLQATTNGCLCCNQRSNSWI